MTGHTRPLPTGRPIASALRRLLARMRDDAAQRMARGGVPDLSAWLPTMIEVMEPVLMPLWATGARYSLANLRRQGAAKGKSLSRRVTKDLALKPTILFDFDLFNPRILTAIRQQVYNFCEETLATLTLDVQRGLQTFAHELGASLETGEGYRELSRRTLAIFDDPYRASRIAQTEAPRAVHGGQFLADKESGIVEKKQWLASADACEICLRLAGKGEIPLDEPFYVNPKGGPYAVCMYPGVHPFCMCTYLSLVRPGAEQAPAPRTWQQGVIAGAAGRD